MALKTRISAEEFDDLPEALRQRHGEPPRLGASLKATLAQAEREALLAALAECDGNRTRAAKRLGIAKSSFYEKLTRHGLLGD